MKEKNIIETEQITLDEKMSNIFGDFDIKKPSKPSEINTIVEKILKFSSDEQVDIFFYIIDKYYSLSGDENEKDNSELILSDRRFNSLREKIRVKLEGEGADE